MASSSGKQKSTRPRPLTDEDLQNFLDMLDNDDDDDGALTDTDIEDGDSDDDDEDTETNFVNIVDNEVGTNINSSDTNEDETTNDDEIIRTVDHNDPIRCAKLPIVGKPDYKAKKQKLAICKWVCQKCSRSFCKDHLNSLCNRCFQAM